LRTGRNLYGGEKHWGAPRPDFVGKKEKTMMPFLVLREGEKNANNLLPGQTKKCVGRQGEVSEFEVQAK